MSRSDSVFPHRCTTSTCCSHFYEAAKTHYYGPMLAANRAHAVMLCRCKIISEANAKALLDALQAVEELGADELKRGGGVEDLFFAMENKLIESAGAAYGGNLQLARSRNDLGYALTRLALRPLPVGGN